MAKTPSFPELLSLVDERSAALRAAVADAPDLDARVPACPAWSLRDLVAHVGEVQRFWAVAVAAGPSEEPPTQDMVRDNTPQGDLLAWSADSTALLLTALRTAGPKQECWAWWEASEAPLNAGAVARHQVQEAAVHAYDAQETAGRPESVPADVAVDGVAEFLTVSYGTSGPWPHGPARIGWHAAEGPSWYLDLNSSGAVIVRSQEETPAAAVHGSASDLVLASTGAYRSAASGSRATMLWSKNCSLGLPWTEPDLSGWLRSRPTYCPADHGRSARLSGRSVPP